MKIKVFHYVYSPETFESWDIVTVSWEFVVEIETENLETGFRETNSIDTQWREKTRSTSVGDIFVTEDGVNHMVGNIGFFEIPEIPHGMKHIDYWRMCHHRW